MKPQFPIIQEGGEICRFCGRFFLRENGTSFECRVCDIGFPCCHTCYNSGRRKLQEFHDRREHNPTYSVDLV